MSRDDDDRFEDDDDMQRRNKSAFPVWAIVLLCALPFVSLLVIGGAVAMFLMPIGPPAPPMANNATVLKADDMAVAKTPSRLVTRDAFKKFLGAPPEDVTAAFGEPQVKFANNERMTWHYHNKTRDPATGKVDPVARVVFVGGVVVEIKY